VNNLRFEISNLKLPAVIGVETHKPIHAFTHLPIYPFTHLPIYPFTSHESQATSSALYICRESSTNQLLFMQNKANVKIGNMNVSIAIS